MRHVGSWNREKQVSCWLLEKECGLSFPNRISPAGTDIPKKIWMSAINGERLQLCAIEWSKNRHKLKIQLNKKHLWCNNMWLISTHTYYFIHVHWCQRPSPYANATFHNSSTAQMTPLCAYSGWWAMSSAETILCTQEWNKGILMVMNPCGNRFLWMMRQSDLATRKIR